MTIKDPIKEIIDKFEEKISSLKKDREKAIRDFKTVINATKIEELKIDLNNNEAK